MIYVIIMFCIGLIIGGFASGNNTVGVIGIIGVVVLTIIGLTTNYIKQKSQFDSERHSAFNSYYSNSNENKKTVRRIIPLNKLLDNVNFDGILENTQVIIGETHTSKFNPSDNNIYISLLDASSQEKFGNAIIECVKQALSIEEDFDDDIFDEEDTTDNDLFDDVYDDEEVFEEEDDDSEDEIVPYINGIGEIVNEETFLNLQQRFSGFSFDFSFNADRYAELKNSKNTLSVYEKSRLILPMIFGNYNCEINLDKALEEANSLLNSVVNKKPKEILVRDNKVHTDWLQDFAIPQILLGTIFAYKGEYIKSAYHFMLGLKTEALSINMGYCDFIKYILTKIEKLATEEVKYMGCGFSANDPMGSCGGNTLIPENARIIIPEMEGKNGEVIIARNGRTGMFGYLERIGSTHSEKLSLPIDIYETLLIDKNYNISKIRFYFNGYFDFGKGRIKSANGFKIKSYSSLYQFNEIIEE